MTSQRQATVRRLLQAAVIFLAAGWVYSPCLHGGWLWDDDGEIAGNLDLRRAGGLARIWFHPATPDYLPLKTSVQWVQWHLWRGNVTGYHLTNVALHVLSALLFWHLLRMLRAPCAWLGGLIFAVHPLAVESVAWISELKNTLSLPFLLLAMIAWVEWDRRWNALSPTHLSGSEVKPARGKPLAPPAYLVSLFCFLAALLCKGSVVMFPAVLLLYAWWRRGRISRRDALASAPFFAVALALGLIAISFQFHRAFGGEAVPALGFLARAAAAGLAIGFYFWKCIFPAGLLVVYPRWDVEPPAAVQFLPWVVIAGVIIVLCLKSRRVILPRPEAAAGCFFLWRTGLFGLGFFLINLLPVLGFVPMAYQRISWVADHFAYISLLGIAGLATAGIAEFWPKKAAGGAMVFVLIAALAWQARRHAAIFGNEEALWSDTVRHNPSSWLAYDNLGNAEHNAGHPAEAIADYEQALRLRPDYAEAEVNLGVALGAAGRLAESLDHFGAALRINPNIAAVHDKLGGALAANGRADAAIGEYREALRLDPGAPEAHYDLGLSLAKSGQLDAAIEQFGQAVQLNPDYFEAHNNLAVALSQAGRFAEAIPHFERAVQLDPGNAVVRSNFGQALRALGRMDEARAQWQEAASLTRR